MRKFTKPVSAVLAAITSLSVFSIVPFSVDAAESVPYIERTWKNSAIVETSKTCEDCSKLSESDEWLKTGWYVVDRDLTLSKRLGIANDQDVHLILKDGCKLKAPKGVTVYDTGSLTVYGQTEDTGVLEAYNPDGAGIGGLDEKKAGTMVFKGGTINATGGGKDAGIGTGKNSDSKFRMIEVYGGNVNAQGGYMGAGIGAGRDNKTNNEVINIYGGNVNANGGKYGAGIGGGDNGNGGWINIYNGDVTAYGGKDAAGIGGGEDGNAVSTTISGGTVKADAGDGAAIGGGEDGTQGTIFIDGGTVKAKSHCGAGIGGGNCEDTSGSITINGGTIFATSLMGAGIGGGNHSMMESSITINGGDVYARAGISNEITSFDMMTKANFLLLPSIPVYAGAGIGAGCWGSQDATITINDGIVHAYGGGSGLLGGDLVGSAGIGGGTEYRTDIISDPAGIKSVTDFLDFFNPDIGDGGEGGPVVINGGIVVAWGGKDSSAIGYGQEGDELGELKIKDELYVYDIGIASEYQLSYSKIINAVKKLQDHSMKEVMQDIKSSLKSDLSIESLKEKINIQEIGKGNRSKTCQGEEKLVVIMPKVNLNNK